MGEYRLLGKSEKTQQLIRANNSFTRESTKIAKGFAIVLMLCHHLFAFPDRIGANASYIPTVSYTHLDVYKRQM